MLYSNQLRKGERYKVPNCSNVFIFGGRYGNNIKCFTREHDGYRFYGREFIEFENGKAYLNLEQLTTASTGENDDEKANQNGNKKANQKTTKTNKN